MVTVDEARRITQMDYFRLSLVKRHPHSPGTPLRRSSEKTPSTHSAE